MADKSDKPHFHGHRARLRQRFLKGGAAALADYELVELLLFQAKPRGDVKPLAKALIEQFGGFAGVLRATPADLAQVAGMGEASVVALKTVEAAALQLSREELLDRPLMGSWDKVLDYCRAAMGHAQVEQLRLLFLDRKNGLIADELQQTGTVDHTPLYPREVVKRALELGASAVILVHNHPSGDPSPSRADIDMTREVAEAGAKLGVTLHDHIIISKSGHASLKSMGVI